MNEEQIKHLKVLALKEELLNQIVVWLKAKGIYEEASKDIPLLPRKDKE